MNDKSHAATPANATPRELELELHDGNASPLAKHEHTSDAKVVLAACQLQDLLRSVARDAAESVLLMHLTEFIVTDTSTGPKRSGAPALTTKLLPETVGDRLKRLYPEHYVRIITLMNEDAGARETARTLSSTRPYTLSIAFVWYHTTEGWDFWAKLAERERS